MTVHRRQYLVAVAAATTVAGCLHEGTGTLATRVTDQPGDIDDFDQCVVSIAGIWLGPADAAAAETDDDADGEETGPDETPADGDGEDDSSDGREYHEFEEPQEADLVQLQDGETQLVDEREVEADTYAYLQLDVVDVDATLESGESATVAVPGEAPLTFNESFEVRVDTRTVFTADFTPVQRGQAGGYLLQPVAEGIDVQYEPVE